ncbi:unnamed protein product [Lota lota]
MELQVECAESPFQEDLGEERGSQTDLMEDKPISMGANSNVGPLQDMVNCSQRLLKDSGWISARNSSESSPCNHRDLELWHGSRVAQRADETPSPPPLSYRYFLRARMPGRF